jgi:tetratricopeptide (TPR) repeat protein
MLLAGLAFAQAQQQRVRDELVKTDQVIAEVKPIVERSGIEEARQLLKWATDLQQAAWQAFQGSLFGKAKDLTMRARERARQAKLVADINPDKVREEVRRTRDVMTEFGPAIIKANDPRANELWKMAQTEQRAAEDYLARARYGYALKFTMAAREHGKAAFAAIRGRVDIERVKRELDRTDALIEKAQARLGSGISQRATDVLNKAIELQRQARQALADGKPLQALKLTLAARDLLLRAWEAGRPKVTPDLVEQALVENDALIAEWSDVIRKAGDTKAAGLLDQGIQHQEIARGLFQKQLLKPALAECSPARKLLKRAVEMIQTEDAPGGQK